MVVERIVCQRAPEVYAKESSCVAYEQLTKMLDRSDKTWADIEMVYQLCERRTKMKRGVEVNLDIVGLYLQGKRGQMDYKYLEGLDFLIPIKNVHREIMEFFEGSWNKENGGC